MAKHKSHKANAGQAPKAPRPSKEGSSTRAAGTSSLSFTQRAPFLCLVLGVLVFSAFSPSLRDGFVEFDDDFYVTKNLHVQQGFTPENIQWAFQSTANSNWHPLTWLSHMLDCCVFGLNPAGHHFTNVLLHSLNVVLLFLVLRQMTGAVWRSFLVAAFFGLHPLRVESVTWIAERKDVLSTTFWMLTLWAYAGFVRATGTRGARTKLFYGLALLFYTMGLMCKSMLVSLPCVLLLLDYWPLNRWKKTGVPGLLIEKIPFFLAAFAAGAVTYLAQKGSGAMAWMEIGGLSFADRAGNGVVAYARYVGKLFWPAQLACFYPHPGHWPAGTVLFGIVFLLGISTCTILLARQRPYLPVGWFWFVGTLVPVIGLVQVGRQSIADRYMYIPGIGLLLLLIWGVGDLTRGWRQRPVVGFFAAAVLLSACVTLTVQQIRYWNDTETLFRHAIAVTENNCVAHNYLGVLLDQKGHLDEAITEYQLALQIFPDYPGAQKNLAHALFRRGRFDEAIREYLVLLTLRPGDAVARNNLGLALSRKGRLDEAVVQYQESLRFDPGFAEAQNNWGIALSRQGHSDQGIAHFEEALRLKPDYAEAHNNLAITLGTLGRLDEAIDHYQKALKLNPNFAQAHNNLGVALENKGNLDEAIHQFEVAVELNADFKQARENLDAARRKKEAVRP